MCVCECVHVFVCESVWVRVCMCLSVNMCVCAPSEVPVLTAGGASCTWTLGDGRRIGSDLTTTVRDDNAPATTSTG